MVLLIQCDSDTAPCTKNCTEDTHIHKTPTTSPNQTNKQKPYNTKNIRKSPKQPLCSSPLYNTFFPDVRGGIVISRVAWMLKEQLRELSGLSLGVRLSSPALDRSAGSGQDCLPFHWCHSISWLILYHIVGLEHKATNGAPCEDPKQHTGCQTRGIVAAEVSFWGYFHRRVGLWSPYTGLTVLVVLKTNSTIHVLVSLFCPLFAKLSGPNPVCNEL